MSDRFRPRPIGRQVIAITGGTSGIGLATALRAAQQGARIALIARPSERLTTAARIVALRGPTPLAIAADVADRDAVAAALNRIVATFGRVDTWVNNAGVTVYGPVSALAPDEVERVIWVDLMGVIHGSMAVLSQLRAQEGGGALVNVGSVLSERAFPLQAPYAAAKHGVRGFTDALRLELEDAGAPVAVTLIEPASIDTPFFGHARSRMGVAGRAIPPVSDPDVVAAAILRAARGSGPRRATAGAGSRVLTLLGRLSPSLVDRLIRVRRVGWSEQQADAPPPAPDNLVDPSPGPPRVRGSERIFAPQGGTDG